MAEVISHHHHRTMIAGGGSQQSPAAPYRQRSKSRTEVPPSPRPQPQSQAVPSVAATTTPPTSADTRIHQEQEDAERSSYVKTEPPSPPSSSSPNPRSYTRQQSTSQQDLVPADVPYKEKSENAEADGEVKMESSMAAPPVPRSAIALEGYRDHEGSTIKVRDLAHIQSFANEEFSPYNGQEGRRRTADDPALKYEISGMPIGDIIEMVAGLLTKITTTNDRQHENLHRPIPGENAVNLSGLSSSVLAFHGKNVPSITILSYLSRIHKYCPTTYEVFLSLLVYFDRMTERVNAAPMQALRRDSMEQETSRPSTSYSADGSDLADSPPMPATSKSVPEIKEDLDTAQYTHAPAQTSGPDVDPIAFPLSHFFVVDSFNIHRLVIAGVTCASKFFSDVFYTNSRYAKVGGLPLAELNHLELQFLLLNDFRLSVPVEELEAYGTMLVEFYAREVVSQRPVDPASYTDDAEIKGPAVHE
ncbi:PHO85 cyclin-6 [Hyphodiscus hymeniophilus]|uniref:PHO85 cyclin-6 n=1 Tax=Hyphodiscus hymeniophilus TaxID=353542 RepID=A0A9P7AZ74_9HELO|nr:PHO85 cyclin-6 [Hyphodiscus hymeniophilus]